VETTNLLIPAGGTGRVLAEEVLGLGDAADVLDRTFYLDLDESSVARWPGKGLCLGVSSAEAATYIDPRFLASPRCPETFRRIARDPDLRTGWLQGTREGARGDGILTLVSVIVRGNVLERELVKFLSRFTGRTHGARVMLHIACSEAGGAGATLAALLLDLVSLGILPVAGVRLWLLPALFFKDAAPNGNYAEWVRRRHLGAEAALRKRIREVSLRTPAGLAHGLIVETAGVRLIGPDGATVTRTRDAAVHDLAAALAVCMRSGLADPVGSSAANDDDLVASTVTG